jgi:hypothetical protein
VDTRTGRPEGEMADIVNLNQYRKRRDRHAVNKRAAENRVRHGRTKIERERGKQETEKNRKDLDDKRLE